jgi:drug/metabolite transporter (DMT)-like permease
MKSMQASGIEELTLDQGTVVRRAVGNRAARDSKQFMGVEVGPKAGEESKPPNTKKLLLLLLVCSLFWGLSIFIPSLQAYLESPSALGRATILFVFIAGYAFASVFYVAYRYRELLLITYRVHRFAFLAGLTQAVGHSGYTLLIRSGGESSLLAPLAGGLYLVVPVFMGLVFLKEAATPQKIIGIVLAVGAILLLSITDTSSFSLTSGLTFLYFLMAFFGWGFDVFFMTLMGMTDHHSAVTFVHTLGLIAGGIILVPSYADLNLTRLTLGHYLNFGGGMFSAFGAWTYFALSHVGRDSSLVAPLSSLYIVWPVIWGLAFLSDVFTLGKILGIFVAIFAIVLMSISDMKAFTRSLKNLFRRPTVVTPLASPLPTSIARTTL